ncbi:MAG: sugar phosphate isomerase/epimerase [Armatimonadetes bacterium]|nr:sugar phosphate isomerase/epimerase [Armatimonadota bacterium]
MARIPIALELYSVREDCAKDLPGTLEAVARMGYEGVEFAGYHGYSAAELRKMVDDNGLKVAGTHIGLDTLLGDQFEKTVEFNQTIGNPFLIVPGLAQERTASPAAWRETANIFNEVAANLKPLGLKTGYHNHHTEFNPMDGELPWDIFFGETVPDVVMQFDLGNALFGGADLVSILKRYPGRCDTIHLKPYSKKAGAENPEKGFDPIIGDDDVPWKEIFHLCETQGNTKWYTVEYESAAYPSLEAVDLCLKALKALGK